MQPNYYEQSNIGTCRYTVSYHDGHSTHRDGSPFYGIKIFRNRRAVGLFIRDLARQGYVERAYVRESR